MDEIASIDFQQMFKGGIYTVKVFQYAVSVETNGVEKLYSRAEIPLVYNDDGWDLHAVGMLVQIYHVEHSPDSDYVIAINDELPIVKGGYFKFQVWRRHDADYGVWFLDQTFTNEPTCIKAYRYQPNARQVVEDVNNWISERT